jgi:hypothetical protein
MVSEISEQANAIGTNSIKVKTHSKIKALEMLCRHLGIFQDNLNVKGEFTFADLWGMVKDKAGKSENG